MRLLSHNSETERAKELLGATFSSSILARDELLTNSGQIIGLWIMA